LRWISLCVVLVLTLGACSNATREEPIAWHAEQPATLTSAVGTPSLPDVQASPEVTPQADIVPLTPDQLTTLAPNELGLIPILEYHVITADPEEEEQFTRTVDDFKADLAWLYEHNFYVVPLRDVVDNTISAPAGKSPVALTFDDANSFQFSATVDASGALVPDPNSAVGILEEFFASHPDFGHTAHFGIVPNNCFAFPDESQMPLCHDKLKWLADHGYEIGNHTWTHANLRDVDDETFKAEIGKTKQFIDQWVTGPANQSDILTLPFGEYPDRDLHQQQRKWMRDGFTYEGTEIHLKAGMMVGANPTESPNSSQWDSMFIARIQMFDASVEEWFTAMTDGSHPVYVSDGNPNIVTMPDPLPSYLADQYDIQCAENWGLDLVEYDPETGAITYTSAGDPDQADKDRNADDGDSGDKKHRKKPPKH
jgi:peptidoglycan/xylan/chitin deacetylase (PgdA/CDA1 family)